MKGRKEQEGIAAPHRGRRAAASTLRENGVREKSVEKQDIKLQIQKFRQRSGGNLTLNLPLRVPAE